MRNIFLMNMLASLELYECLPQLIFTAFIVFVVYYLLLPQNIIRDFRSNYTVRHHRNAPPLYPNGWLPIIESSDINGSKILNLQICGEEIIVFRDSKGEINVFDAYCPHLGANLSHGGQKISIANEDCIRCPFHGWAFRAKDGNCTYIPYTINQNTPKGVSLKKWTSIELNGFVYIWYHADGLEPNYEVPKIDEINSKWFYGGRTEHIFNAIYQDIPENGADLSHFKSLHTASMFSGSNLDSVNKYPIIPSIITHTYDADWQPCEEPKGYMSLLMLVVKTYLFGYCFLTMDMRVEQIGPSVVHLFFKSFAGIEGTFIQNVIPIRPYEQKVIQRIYVSGGVLAKLWAKFVLHGEATMLERDIVIWRKKKFASNPKFVKEDQPILKYRKWFSQFYSENSKREKNLLDW